MSSTITLIPILSCCSTILKFFFVPPHFSSTFARLYLNRGSTTTQRHPADTARRRHRVLRLDPAPRIRIQLTRIDNDNNNNNNKSSQLRTKTAAAAAAKLVEQQQHHPQQCQMQTGGQGLLSRHGRIVEPGRSRLSNGSPRIAKLSGRIRKRAAAQARADRLA